MNLNSDKLKELMEINGLSQNKLAVKANVSKGTISRVLSGKRGVGRKVASGLLRIFPNETIDTLFETNKN
ncbi:DNA-binding protein [Clostridium sp. DMHC 10]|uniref:helix-turn-helix domain-containing protein n=1 Tax=Clostridium sp. DMHC 10 TaxID=747377 RepID=UPI00069D8924|nr:helix-turn-helix transcriptional regulator [Clostridium sp. DMHC 10]KOF56141.1 DNA-binding protein [Clostridium sp. DMHC 10]